MKVIETVRNWLESGEPKQFIEDFRRDPRVLIDWLEKRNKLAARKALNVASEIIDPQLLGMGAVIESLSDDFIEVSLPFRWKNRPLGGMMDTGVLVTLAEFSSRLIWSRHYDIEVTSMSVEEVEVRVLKSIKEKIWCRIHLNSHESDKCLYRLYSTGESRATQEISFFNSEQLLVAQLSLRFVLKGGKALSGHVSKSHDTPSN